jgi:hypothetical protein
MDIRTILVVPESLYDRLRRQAERSGSSIRGLIVSTLEQKYGTFGKKKPVAGPLVHSQGKLGPRFPLNENPHDLSF